MKKVLIGFIAGIILCGGIEIYATSLYKAKDISYNKENWEVNNVNDAIDSLYNNTIIGDAKSEDILEGKTALVKGTVIKGTLKKGGYVALFNGSSSITTSVSTVALKYFDETFGSKSGNTITLTTPGNYRIIGTVAHSPLNSSCTSHLRLYINGSNPNTAGNNHVSYWTINKALTVNENETYTIKATMDSDCNLDGLRGGTMVVIKES